MSRYSTTASSQDSLSSHQRPKSETGIDDTIESAWSSTDQITHGKQSSDTEWKPGKQEYAVMVTIAVVSLMVALDATILVPVLSQLAIDLGGTTSDAFWAGTSYLLTCAVFQPFIAALSDLFGRKELLLLAILFFTIGTLLCAPLADDFTVFLVGRCLQGIGGGGIITMGQVIFADIIPLRQRPKYFSIVLAAWALGSVLGPLTGGLFVERLSWRWCFYINFPFCALGFVMVPLFVKLTTAKSSFASKVARIDWLGGLLFIGGMTSFLVGLSWAGIQFEWWSVQVLAPIFIGLSALIAAIGWEKFGAREPFLRPALFSSPSAIAAYACAFGQGFLLFCGLYDVPFYFSAIHLHGPIQSGLDLLPVTCLLLPGSIFVSILTTRLGRFRWAIWIGWAITSLGSGLLLLLDLDTPVPVWVTVLCVFGVGNGMVLTSVNVAIQAISRAEDCGRAAAMYAFMRTLGMSIGVAVGGTAFQNVMSAKLKELALPDAIAHNAEAFVHQLAALQPSDPIRTGALTAYLQGFHAVFWVMTATALSGLVVSLFIKKHSMDKALESRFVLAGGAPAQAGSQGKHESQVSNPASALLSRYCDETIQLVARKVKSQDAGGPGKGKEMPQVRAFLVGPGGLRLPLNPVSGGPVPLPNRISQQIGVLPTAPQPIYASEADRRRISLTMKTHP